MHRLISRVSRVGSLVPLLLAAFVCRGFSQSPTVEIKTQGDLSIGGGSPFNLNAGGWNSNLGGQPSGSRLNVDTSLGQVHSLRLPRQPLVIEKTHRLIGDKGIDISPRRTPLTTPGVDESGQGGLGEPGDFRDRAPKRTSVSEGAGESDVRQVKIGIRNLDDFNKEVIKSRGEEAAGAEGAMQKALMQVYEAQQRRADAGPPDIADIGEGVQFALPDPKRLGPERALRAVAELAMTANSVDAAMLLGYGLSVASEYFPKREASRQSEAILIQAVLQADRGVRATAQQGFEESVAGRMTSDRKRKVFYALDFWNTRLLSAGLPFVANMAGFKSVIGSVADMTRPTAPDAPSLESGAFKTTPAGSREETGSSPQVSKPRLRFEKMKLGSGATALRAVVTLPEALSKVAAVPPVDAVFEFKSAVVAAMEKIGEPSPLATEDFIDLRPHGRGAFSAAYAAAKTEGRSDVSSLWMALRYWAEDEAGGFWARLKRAVGGLLGLTENARPAEEPAVVIRAEEERARVLTRALDVYDPAASGHRASSVRVARVGLTRDAAPLRARFEAFKGVMENSSAALDLLALNAGRVTVGTAKAAYARLKAAAAAYDQMSGAREQTAAVEELWNAIVSKTQGLSDADPLPKEASNLIVLLDQPSLYRSARRLREQAVESLGRSRVAVSPNFLMRIKDSYQQAREVFLLDLSDGAEGAYAH